ncbi:MAG: SGNH/GDSL hydrolase family protein [Planctomycetota bacterium]
MQLTSDDIVLFQGDSITDAGRVREDSRPNAADFLGHGYATLAAARLLADLPGLTAHNRGISGNRVTDLRDRWQADCLDLRPTVLSILIGVNDTWHGVASGTPHNGTTLPEFDRVYRQLLDDTKERLPGVKLVICEPFVLECGAVLEMNFHPDIGERAKLVHAIAEDYADVFVAFQSVLNAALADAGPEVWLFDGVHPTLAGHQRMADAWLQAVT